MALLLLSPILAVLCVAVLVTEGRPILFKQLRIGRHDRPFRALKLRTMTDTRDASGNLLPDRERLTPLGRWLRSTSADELPELWNVLLGDMSLVGPRPLPATYLPRYTSAERRRHDVRPGLTGWAQVHGRNSVGWDERLSLDVWYVEHHSLLLDLRIVLRTVGLVVRRHGISGDGTETMRELRPHLAHRRSADTP